MKTIGIYKVTSPSGKIYIGQSINCEFRFIRYKRKSQVKTQIKLKRSFEKYGVENHIFEIIEVCNESSLNERERYWQEFYDVLGINGLNCKLTKSLDKSGKLSKETYEKCQKTWQSKEYKKKCSERLKGKCLFTKEQIEQYSKARKNIHRKDEVKRKISITKRINSKYTIIQTDMNNVFIKEWNCLAEIKEETGFDKPNIYNCLIKKYKHAYGYKWYKKDK